MKNETEFNQPFLWVQKEDLLSVQTVSRLVSSRYRVRTNSVKMSSVQEFQKYCKQGLVVVIVVVVNVESKCFCFC